MASLDMIRTPSVAGSARRMSLFTLLIAAFQKWNDARQTRKALSSLTDRELDDIGLVRGDIDMISYR